jgi:hypothetical protein
MQFPRLKTNAKAIVQSFYSPPLYRDVIYNWKGFGGLYVLLLAFILAFLLSAMMGISSEKFKKHQLPQILAQMPRMVILDGVLNVYGEQPVSVAMPRTKNSKDDPVLLAYIDTHAAEEELFQQKGKARIIVGASYMLMQSQGVYKRREFNGIRRLDLDPSQIQGKWPDPLTLTLVFWPLMTLGLTLNFLIMAVVVTVCSYIVTAFMQEEYDFETRMRISAIAMTPSLLLSKGLILTVGHSTETWFDVLLAVFYFYVMIVASRKLNTQPELPL